MENHAVTSNMNAQYSGMKNIMNSRTRRSTSRQNRLASTASMMSGSCSRSWSGRRATSYEYVTATGALAASATINAETIC
jgi:hypothetical protein